MTVEGELTTSRALARPRPPTAQLQRAQSLAKHLRCKAQDTTASSLGRRWREVVYPEVKAFIAAQNRHEAKSSTAAANPQPLRLAAFSPGQGKTSKPANKVNSARLQSVPPVPHHPGQRPRSPRMSHGRRQAQRITGPAFAGCTAADAVHPLGVPPTARPTRRRWLRQHQPMPARGEEGIRRLLP